MSRSIAFALAGIALLIAGSVGGQSFYGLYDQGVAFEAQGKIHEAIAMYERAARSRNGKAAKRLGEIYTQGAAGIDPDPTLASRWYARARMLGEAVPPPSAVDLAVAKASAAQERAKAVEEIRSANADLYEQARALEAEGKGNEAVKLHVRAARSGNGKAASRLCEIYDKGLAGVERDYAESRKWCNAARVLGEEVPQSKVDRSPAPPPAASQMATPRMAPPSVTCRSSMCEQALALEREGRGAEAVRLYTQAARSGDGLAAKRLGEIYENGLSGMPRDYAQSLSWYNTARVLGEEVPMAKSR